MPGSSEHAILGGLSGVLYALKLCNENNPIVLGDVIVCGLAGAVGGVIPDAVEPATDPRHRSFFHSISALGISLYSHKKINENPNMEIGKKLLIGAALSGYDSHLLVDSGTPSGLPVIHRKLI